MKHNSNNIDKNLVNKFLFNNNKKYKNYNSKMIKLHNNKIN